MSTKLSIYSLGIVVTDNPQASDIIEVYPVEIINLPGTGHIKSQEQTFESNLNSTDSSSFNKEIKSKNYIKAKWLSLSVSNRATPPCVYKNETVLLFKYAEIDEYYWCTIFHEPHIRRREVVKYSYSNLKKGLEPYDDNSSYYFLVDTINKLIELSTSDNDGELTKYSAYINTEKGILEIRDFVGQSIKIDSEKGEITIKAKNKINLICSSGEINNTAKTNINFKSEKIVGNISSSVNYITPVVNNSANVNVGSVLRVNKKTQTSDLQTSKVSADILSAGNINASILSAGNINASIISANTINV